MEKYGIKLEKRELIFANSWGAGGGEKGGCYKRNYRVAKIGGAHSLNKEVVARAGVI